MSKTIVQLSFDAKIKMLIDIKVMAVHVAWHDDGLEGGAAGGGAAGGGAGYRKFSTYRPAKPCAIQTNQKHHRQRQYHRAPVLAASGLSLT